MGRPVDGPGKKPPVPPKSEEIIFDEDDIKPPSKEYEFKEGEPGTMIKARILPSKEYVFKEGEPGTIITVKKPIEHVFSDGEGSTVTVKKPADKRLAQLKHPKPLKTKLTLGEPVQLYPVRAKNSQGQFVEVFVSIPKNVKETSNVLKEGFVAISRERIDPRSLAQLPAGGTLYLPPTELPKVK